ncbi:MAG: ATP-binding protein, partial [Gammaproteobacteria bacterium]|nr:ATP-binding protein [Gammaproteobacteria bacterium]
MTDQATAETRGFQTEARKLLQLMISSLYSNREIFLRELISNASDAIDRLRFESLKDESLIADDPEFRIVVEFDNDAGTVAVVDNGIGMSREEAVANLGTIAKSGTEEFFGALTGDEQKDSALIGQFGVGFYCSFIVPREVEVLTRRTGDEAGTRWASTGEEESTVEERADLPRGTRVTLTLKDDAKEFAESFRLRSVLRKYSDHVGVPVMMAKEDGDDDKEAELETVNSAKALWTRRRNDVSEDEYKEFYKHVSHDFEDPVVWSHNK